MYKIYFRISFFSLLVVIALLSLNSSTVQAGFDYQQPTVDVPTVTGTPQGAMIRVNADQAQINVRSGPGTHDYDIIGIMIAGQVAPAYGRSAGGSWIQVGYPGVEDGVAWVYSPLVTLIQGSDLPILEPPPTSVPRVTITIDPTVAAQFVQDAPPTRMPTFTYPPPLVVPTIESEQQPISTSQFPFGLLIAAFGIVGIFGAIFSLLRGK